MAICAKASSRFGRAMTPEELFTTALGLGQQWRVVECRFEGEPKSLELRLEHVRGEHFACSQCGTLCGVHDTIERRWRHMNFFQYRCELAFAQIATEKSSKRLFLRKSDRHPLLNLEQRSRSKRNKWRGPPSAAREGSSPFMPDWFLSVAEGSAYRCDEPKTLLTSLPISHTRQRRAITDDRPGVSIRGAI